ncbi:hypothetical protein ABT336_15490 [Micromonospora sp. NPDC000207]|uniref:hypothetical protein n=1 Tax=Micromonospora sp. NPDC000207 TaxID=3154246 RepID=UPI00332F3BB7
MAVGPEMLAMIRQGGVVAWVMALPGGDCWIIDVDGKNVVHTASLRSVEGFWAAMYDAEVGLVQVG